MINEAAAGDFHLVARGSGPPVILLHGNPDSSHLWREVIDRISHGFLCISPDLPGFGRSPVPPEFDGGLDAMAAWVERVVEHAVPGSAPVHLVSHDIGSIFGLAWAMRNPHRVSRLAVGGFPFSSDYRWHFWGRVWRTPLLGELAMLLLNRWLFFREVRAGGPKLSDDHIAATYDLLSPQTRRTILKIYRSLDPDVFADWETGLQRLLMDKPTLVMWGQKDPFIAASYAERLRADRLAVFPECGHWFPAEEPVAVAGLLAEFFSAHKG